MGKYDTIPLRRIKARIEHQCNRCEHIIQPREYYYTQKDIFLHFLHKPKKFCSKCYEEHGQELLMVKNKASQDKTSRGLDNYFEKAC